MYDNRIKYNNNLRKTYKNGPKLGQSSLVIVFDATGSMVDDLEQLRQGAKMIIEKITKRDDNPIYNYIFVPFRDPHVGPKLVTTNQTKLLNELNALELWGGGDCPESALEGIKQALQSALPKSYVYVFTDAIAKDYILESAVVELIQKKQITITFLLTGYCKSKNSIGYEVYERLSLISNGQIYDLNKNDVHNVLENIKNSLDIRQIPLQYYGSKIGKINKIDFNVDNSLKEFSVSIAGSQPNITVFDPKKDVYNKSDSEILKLDNLKVVNIADPQPGKWNIEASSSSAHSVKLFGKSDLNFKYGFSTIIPKTISETSFTPLLGAKNILTIFPTNSTLIYNLTNILITKFDTVNDNDNPKHELNLPLKINNLDLLYKNYITEEFMPPADLFKIYLNGYDVNGNEIKRLISTAIKSKEESPPDVSANPSTVDIYENETIHFICHVTSLTPVTIQWKIKTRILIEIHTNQSSELILTIPQAQLTDTNKYICFAENKAGNNIAATYARVKLLPTQLNVQIKNKNDDQESIKVILKDNLNIQCHVEANREFTVKWTHNNIDLIDWRKGNENTTILQLNNINKNASGEYMCHVKIFNEIKNASTSILVQYQPELLENNDEVIFTHYGDEINLTCNANAIPMAQINWYFIEKDRTKIHLTTNNNIFYDELLPKHVGEYLCEADNGIGKKQEKIITIEAKPVSEPLIEKPANNEIIANTGDDIEILCKCHYCSPLTNYEWSNSAIKFGNQLTENKDNMIATRWDILNNYSNGTAVYKLKIENVSNDDQYECLLENALGKDLVKFKLVILVPPKIEKIVSTNETEFDGVNLNVIEGSSTYIKCEVKGMPIPVIQWSKDGLPIIYTKRIYSKDNKSLTLSEASPADAGIYECQAINPLGIITKNFSLIVIIPPKLINDEEQLQTAIEGQNIILPCSVHALPPPTITWLMNGHILNTNTTKYLKDNDTNLSFVGSVSDTGIYECRATNQGGNVTQELVLLIYAAPIIEPANDEIIKVTPKSDVVIKCDAIGFPLPEISWNHDGLPVNNTYNIDISEDGLLEIKNFQEEDEGAYVCDAFNGVGITQKIFYLAISDPPKIISDFDDKLTVLPGEEITLSCNAIGNPNPAYYWAKNGERLDDELINENSSSEKLLKINFQNNLTSGIYSCYAENIDGFDNKDIEIIFIERPKLNTKNLKLKENLVLGEKMELICPFDNYEKIEWYKNNEKLITTNNIQINDRKIEINKIKMIDDGNYTCYVENQAGSDSITFERTLFMPPIIRYDNDKEIIINNGENFYINCIADGNPKPTIVWKNINNNNVIVSLKEDFEIKNINIHDSGVYTCVATNIMGTTEKSYKINVIAPPIYNLDEQEKVLQKIIHDNLVLDCLMIGNPEPTYVWYKDEIYLDKYTDQLVIDDIQITNNGTYKCIGKNPFGYQVVTYHLYVFYPPNITYITEDIITINKNSLKLKCKANGYPIPILSWIKNGQTILTTSNIQYDKYIYNHLINNNNKIYIDNNSNGYTLNSLIKFDDNHYKYYGKVRINTTINDISLSLTYNQIDYKLNDNFLCIAINAIGRDEKLTNVQILIPPTIDNHYSTSNNNNNNIDILETLPLVLSCNVYGIPTPEIFWIKDNEEITESTSKLIKLTNNRKHLNIIKTSLNDSGLYYCYAKNIIGDVKYEYSVNVLIPPKRLLIDTKYNNNDNDNLYEKFLFIKNGDDLYLECLVNGNPLPIVYWVKIDFQNNHESVLPTNNLILYIPNANESATYKCFANNTVGLYEELYHVIVQHEPKFIDNGDNRNEHNETNIINVKLNHGVNLNCHVSGVPEPNITWFKDDEIITPFNNKNIFLSQDKHILRISSTTKNSTGIYRCFAYNDLGSIEKLFNINVYVPAAWSPWSEWTSCSTTCGPGMRGRNRFCLLPNGLHADGDYFTCQGDEQQIEKCELSFCPVNGEWSDWGNWSQCSTTCNKEIKNFNKSIKIRHRLCNNPEPSMGGKPCQGLAEQTEFCVVPYCPVHGNWSNWSQWSQCSVTCGNGIKTKQRKCNNPSPQYGGRVCIGETYEIAVCTAEKSCPIDGNWSNWSPWSKCSATCGTGTMLRKRLCNNPKPQYNGKNCIGDNVEQESCKSRPCSNYDLVKSISDKKLTPLYTFDVLPIDDKKKLRFEKNHNKKIMYSESAPIEISYPKVPKVTIELKNIMPISDNTKDMHINFHPDKTEITFSQSNPKCGQGYEYNRKLNICEDINECVVNNKCHSTQICVNTIGNYSCTCALGYTSLAVGQKCLDINECTQKLHNCSHYCENIPGSYKCLCPLGTELINNHKCLLIKNMKAIRQPRDKPHLVEKSTLKYSEMICPDGYYVINEKCSDIDECVAMQDECSFDQSCLNTKGSYFCVPTPCPTDYERDEPSGQCVQICNKLFNKKCTDGAIIAQTISHTILTLNNINTTLPILKLINYDINNKPINNTLFNIIEKRYSDIFTTKKIHYNYDLLYLYVNENIKKEIVYKLKIIGKSYDEKLNKLMYITKFIIYIYLM